jgi:hypothetical protein
VEILPITDASFQAYLRQGRLMGTRCEECGELSLPPRAICAKCFSAKAAWAEMPTHGRVLAFTSIYVPPSGPAAEGYGRTNPYCVGIVELDNGLRVSARILGVDAAHPESIPVGLPLVLQPGEMLIFRA